MTCVGALVSWSHLKQQQRGLRQRPPLHFLRTIFGQWNAARYVPRDAKVAQRRRRVAAREFSQNTEKEK